MVRMGGIDSHNFRSRAAAAAGNASYLNGEYTIFVKEFMIGRRQFMRAAAAASTASLLAQPRDEWGGPALDIHLHLRADGESNLAHINGSGVTKAVLLTRVESVDRSRALAEKHPGRFVWFVSAGLAKPESARPADESR